jgi:hypothetical protein
VGFEPTRPFGPNSVANCPLHRLSNLPKVPVEGVEPPRPERQTGLSRQCLPFQPYRHMPTERIELSRLSAQGFESCVSTYSTKRAGFYRRAANPRPLLGRYPSALFLADINQWTLSYDRVQKAGVEPARPCGHMALNHARLPIPPYLLVQILQVFLLQQLPTKLTRGRTQR